MQQHFGIKSDEIKQSPLLPPQNVGTFSESKPGLDRTDELLQHEYKLEHGNIHKEMSISNNMGSSEGSIGRGLRRHTIEKVHGAFRKKGRQRSGTRNANETDEPSSVREHLHSPQYSREGVGSKSEHFSRGVVQQSAGESGNELDPYKDKQTVRPKMPTVQSAMGHLAGAHLLHSQNTLAEVENSAYAQFSGNNEDNEKVWELVAHPIGGCLSPESSKLFYDAVSPADVALVWKNHAINLERALTHQVVESTKRVNKMYRYMRQTLSKYRIAVPPLNNFHHASSLVNRQMQSENAVESSSETSNIAASSVTPAVVRSVKEHNLQSGSTTAEEGWQRAEKEIFRLREERNVLLDMIQAQARELRAYRVKPDKSEGKGKIGSDVTLLTTSQLRKQREKENHLVEKVGITHGDFQLANYAAASRASLRYSIDEFIRKGKKPTLPGVSADSRPLGRTYERSTDYSPIDNGDITSNPADPYTDWIRPSIFQMTPVSSIAIDSSDYLHLPAAGYIRNQLNEQEESHVSRHRDTAQISNGWHSWNAITCTGPQKRSESSAIKRFKHLQKVISPLGQTKSELEGFVPCSQGKTPGDLEIPPNLQPLGSALSLSKDLDAFSQSTLSVEQTTGILSTEEEHGPYNTVVPEETIVHSYSSTTQSNSPAHLTKKRLPSLSTMQELEFPTEIFSPVRIPVENSVVTGPANNLEVPGRTSTSSSVTPNKMTVDSLYIEWGARLNLQQIQFLSELSTNLSTQLHLNQNILKQQLLEFDPLLFGDFHIPTVDTLSHRVSFGFIAQRDTRKLKEMLSIVRNALCMRVIENLDDDAEPYTIRDAPKVGSEKRFESDITTESDSDRLQEMLQQQYNELAARFASLLTSTGDLSDVQDNLRALADEVSTYASELLLQYCLIAVLHLRAIVGGEKNIFQHTRIIREKARRLSHANLPDVSEGRTEIQVPKTHMSLSFTDGIEETNRISSGNLPQPLDDRAPQGSSRGTGFLQHFGVLSGLQSVKDEFASCVLLQTNYIGATGTLHSDPYQAYIDRSGARSTDESTPLGNAVEATSDTIPKWSRLFISLFLEINESIRDLNGGELPISQRNGGELFTFPNEGISDNQDVALHLMPSLQADSSAPKHLNEFIPHQRSASMRSMRGTADESTTFSPKSFHNILSRKITAASNTHFEPQDEEMSQPSVGSTATVSQKKAPFPEFEGTRGATILPAKDAKMPRTTEHTHSTRISKNRGDLRGIPMLLEKVWSLLYSGTFNEGELADMQEDLHFRRVLDRIKREIEEHQYFQTLAEIVSNPPTQHGAMGSELDLPKERANHPEGPIGALSRAWIIYQLILAFNLRNGTCQGSVLFDQAPKSTPSCVSPNYDITRLARNTTFLFVYEIAQSYRASFSAL